MTTTSDQASSPAVMPPPGCPAHVPGAAATRLYGPDFGADSKLLYERLRDQHGPVAPVIVPGETPAWLVLGYQEIRKVLTTPSKFASNPRNWGAVQDGQVGADHPLAPLAMYQPMCNFEDGTAHLRLRSAVRDSLEGLELRGVRRYVERYSRRLIERFGSSGRADLVSQFAEQLPMLVLTQLVGMPEEEGPRLVEACRDLMKGTATAVTSNEYVLNALTALVAQKKAQPGKDLASTLLAHESGLTDQEVVEHLRLILVGANETTSNLITDMLEVVLTEPRSAAQLRGGQMTLFEALDQVLWNTPPLAVLPARYALHDTELGDQMIRSGDMVLLGLAAGNADPAIRPDLSTSMAGNRAHLAFGAGPHGCPGGDIGRSIAETGIDELLRILPDMSLADEAAPRPRTPTWTSSHLEKLPVRFTAPKPASQAAREELPSTAPDDADAPAPGPGPLPEPVPYSSSWWGRLIGAFRRDH
ncbi:cytochrome P450 [Kitasatospora kazusensis]|uniref:Cytochrome P450 n=1 Tax=Kitasatospora kazusensis TaxID=407974 RepID=A0ABP4KCC6_9ACTN